MNTKRKLNPQDVKVAKLDSLKQLQRRAEHFGAKLVLLEPLKGVVS
jgi:hypothetical protein